MLNESDLIRHLTSPISRPSPASALMTSPVVSCGSGEMISAGGAQGAREPLVR